MNQNRYEILETLGKGQNGQTTLACIVTAPAPALVVIKQIYHPQEPLDVLTQRLQTVGQHPQLPALVDSWQTANGQFLVFEYISYPVITQVEPPPWSPEQVTNWLLSLLTVLEHLHSFRLIHGDIRPANIRQANIQDQQPILVDLRITQRLDRQQKALAVNGGDAAYAAPEQALGKLTYASDIYSLGLVAIHLLTGLPPFDLYSIADNRWIWPDLVAEPLPQNLSNVLHKLLKRSLEKRYTRASQAIVDLKKSSVLSLFDKAYSFLIPKTSLSQSLPVLTQSKAEEVKAFSPSTPSAPLIHWQPCYQFTTNSITTALALKGKNLAMGTSTGAVFVCDLATDKEIYTLSGRQHRDRITALAFHPQGRTLYSTSYDGTIKLWDLTSGKVAHTLSQPGWQPTDLAIAKPYLIVSDGTGHITLWDLEQLTRCHSFNQHQDWVSAIATNGERLVSISRDLTLRLWSLSEKRLLETLLIDQSRALALHPNGNYVIVGNDRGQVDVWSVEQPSSKPDRLCAGSDSITALALSPDARLLAVGTDGNALRVYQGTTGQCVSELAQGWGVMALAFDGKILASSSQDETVTIWQRAIQ